MSAAPDYLRFTNDIDWSKPDSITDDGKRVFSVRCRVPLPPLALVARLVPAVALAAQAADLPALAPARVASLAESPTPPRLPESSLRSPGHWCTTARFPISPERWKGSSPTAIYGTGSQGHHAPNMVTLCFRTGRPQPRATRAARPVSQRRR